MAWKKALFLGGAVLLLAACSDATAPTSQLQSKRAPVAGVIGDSTTAGAADFSDPLSLDVDCKSGYYVRSGDKDVCVELPSLF